MKYLIADTAQRFEWVAPWLPDGAPTLKVPGVAIDEAMAAILPARTITAVAADLRSLTVSVAVGSGGTGEYGAVFVDLGSAGRFLSRVEAVEGDTTVVLVDPLPLGQSDIPDPGTSTMSISWLTYFVDLLAAAVGDTVTRGERWRVEWSKGLGDVASRPMRSTGLLSIVRQEPDTGLDHFTLVRHFPHLGGLHAAGASSFAPQIERGMRDLIDMVHQPLPTGRYLDQIDFSQWLNVHEHLTLAAILEDDAAGGSSDETLIQQARHHRELARQAFDARARIAWLDSDDDAAAESRDIAPAPLLGIGYGLDTAVDTPTTDPYGPAHDYEGDI